MPLTLDDQQTAALRAKLAVADAAEQIWNDPSLSDEAKALWKRKFPDAQIGDYDLKKEIFGRLDKEKEEREEERRKAREKADDDDLASKRRALKEKRGFTDDAVERLEKMMIERGIANHEDAADLMASREPAPSDGDAGYDRQFWRHEQSPGYQDIVKDPEGYGRREILKTLREMQARGNR